MKIVLHKSKRKWREPFAGLVAIDKRPHQHKRTWRFEICSCFCFNFLLLFYLFIVQFSFLGFSTFGCYIFPLSTSARARAHPFVHFYNFFSVFAALVFVFGFGRAKARPHCLCTFRDDGKIRWNNNFAALFFLRSRPPRLLTLLLFFLFIFAIFSVFLVSFSAIVDVTFCISTYNIILFSLCSQNLWPTQSKNFKQFSTLWLLLLLLARSLDGVWIFFFGCSLFFIWFSIFFSSILVWVRARWYFCVYITYYAWKLSGSYEHRVWGTIDK